MPEKLAFFRASSSGDPVRPLDIFPTPAKHDGIFIRNAKTDNGADRYMLWRIPIGWFRRQTLRRVKRRARRKKGTKALPATSCPPNKVLARR